MACRSQPGRRRVRLDEPVDDAELASVGLPAGEAGGVGDDEHGDVPGAFALPKAAQDLDPVEAGQEDIQEDQGRRVGQGLPEAGLAVRGDVHLPAVALEPDPVHVRDEVVVLDEEDSPFVGIGRGLLFGNCRVPPGTLGDMAAKGGQPVATRRIDQREKFAQCSISADSRKRPVMATR